MFKYNFFIISEMRLFMRVAEGREGTANENSLGESSHSPSGETATNVGTDLCWSEAQLCVLWRCNNAKNNLARQYKTIFKKGNSSGVMTNKVCVSWSCPFRCHTKIPSLLFYTSNRVRHVHFCSQTDSPPSLSKFTLIQLWHRNLQVLQ